MYSASAALTISMARPPQADLDSARFKVTCRVPLVRVRAVAIQLTVKNNGIVEADAPATVIGEQNGVVVYNETLTVSDPVGNGRSKFDFPD